MDGNSWEGPTTAEVGSSRAMNRFMLGSVGKFKTGGNFERLWGWCGVPSPNCAGEGTEKTP